MTDLRIYINVSANVASPHSATLACADAPPAPGRPDPCQLGVALTLEGPRPPAPRVLYFDRRGDTFVVSPRNSAENLNWVTSQQNLPGVLSALRLTGSLIRGMGRNPINPDTMSYFLWLARYIVSGNFHHDGSSSAAPEMDMTEMLIDAFSGSVVRGLVNLIGSLNLLRRETWIPEEARERIRSVTAILDVVPIYQSLTTHFFTEERIRQFYSLRDGDFLQVARVYQFIRRLAIALHEGRNLRFDRTALEASRAYAAFYRTEIASGTQPDFCQALEAALRERGGNASPGSAFLGECRQALGWAAVPPDQALRESARQTLTDAAGMQRLQQAIAVESRQANMRVDWLSRRGAYGQVFDALLSRLSLASRTSAGQSRLRFDVAGFQADLRRLTLLTSRGEYDLSALAFLRRLFGSEGEPPPFRAFADGLVAEIPWDLSAEELSQIRQLQASLAGRRRSSADFSQVGMPVLLGSTCAVGVGGLVLSQTLPALRSHPDAQLGVGLASSSLAGGGCFGFAGHFLWPAVAPRAVHNRYAWDLGTSVAGSALGFGTYLLIHFLSGGRANTGQRFPVDPFGP